MAAQVLDIDPRHACKFRRLRADYRASSRRSRIRAVTTAGMNGLDYAILALVGLGAFSGLTRGALRMATSILALVLGIYAASVYYGRAAAIGHRYLSTSPALSHLIGYAP